MNDLKHWLAKLDFRDRKTSTVYFLVLFCIGFLLLAGAGASDQMLLVLLGAAFLIAGLVIYLRYHICPKCRTFYRWNPRYCPHCGAQLEDDEQYQP